jgi:hypothetical protein
MTSSYVNAQTAREHVSVLSDGGELRVTLLHGIGPDAGRRCIHRVTTDMAGRLRSDIVYFYDSTARQPDVEADFLALAQNRILSMGQLHHAESMLNRGQRLAR